MAEARMIEMMDAAYWEAFDSFNGKTSEDAMRAALSVLARPENIPTECVMVALREMRDQSPFSTDEWKDAIAKVFAAAAGDEDRRA